MEIQELARSGGAGVLVLAAGSLVSLLVTGGILNIDGTAKAVHETPVQDLIGVIAFVLGTALATACVIATVRIGRPTVVATSASGLAIVGLRRLFVPWTMVQAVRLEMHKRGQRRRVPVLRLRSGACVPIDRASSRFSAATLALIDRSGADSIVSGLPRRRAVVVAQRIQQQLRGVPDEPPYAFSEAASLLSRSSEFPGTPSFRMHSRDVLPPQYRLSIYGVAVVVVERVAASVAGAQMGSGHPFDWGQFLFALVAVLAGVELIALCFMFFAVAELAIGPGWCARRRYFHRQWSIVGFGDLLSVRTRVRRRTARQRAAALPPAGVGIVLQTLSGRQIFISVRMLRAGAAAALEKSLRQNPALFPSAAELLAAGTSAPVNGLPLVDPVKQARRSCGHAWGTLLSFLLVAAGACVLAVSRHAFWVFIPSISAIAALVWLAASRHRELRAAKRGVGGVSMSPNTFDTVGNDWLLRFGQLGMAATIASVALVGNGALNTTSLDIAGAPGYETFAGPAGLPMQVGRPWGKSCQPVVFVTKELPEYVYVEVKRVVNDARADGMDVTVDNNHGKWFPTTLYPTGLTNTDVEFVTVFSNAVATPLLTGGRRPEHILFRWGANPSPNGKTEFITGLTAMLYLKALGGNPQAIRRSARQLVAYAEGVGGSTSPDSGITDGSPVDTFSAKDIGAMRTMGGCR